MTKYEVQKGRTVTCRMGVAHAGAKLTLANFSGEDNEEKQKKIDAIVKLGALKPVPLTKAEKEALVEAEAKAKREAEAAEATEQAEAEAKAKREAAILEADFDQMNKDPMIEFAKKYEIELKGSKADDIRAGLKELQESLTAPE